jgi:DNA-binding transcriptional LysR family regulator
MATNELSLMRAWALGGLGIVMLPEQFVSRDLASGALVEVLAGVLGGESRIAVVYPEKTWLPAPVRAFVEHALAVARAGQLFDSLDESADR